MIGVLLIREGKEKSLAGSGGMGTMGTLELNREKVNLIFCAGHERGEKQGVKG